jgi:hypothetical protein
VPSWFPRPQQLDWVPSTFVQTNSDVMVSRCRDALVMIEFTRCDVPVARGMAAGVEYLV